MKTILVAAVILICISCRKEQQNDPVTKTPTIPDKCGIILTTPVLDSFVFPTYYISATISFPDGNEIVHLHDNVTGDHDGSWFISKYYKGSSFCTAP